MPRAIRNPKLGKALERLREAGVADLTARAERGELPRAYGRDREVEQLFAALLERRSVLLLGPTDVGKTAVLYEAVNRLVQGQAPARLHYSRVVQLSTHTVVAGTSNTGQWTGKLQEIVDAARDGGSILLYFEDIWDLRSTGSYSGHPSSLATYLRPHLERQELILLGESTEDNYTISSALGHTSGGPSLADDPSLMRLFTTIPVEAPDPAATQAIVTAVAADLERRHQARVEPAAIGRVIELTRRFQPYRAFPGKAIHLLEQVVRGAAGERPGDDELLTIGPGLVTAGFTQVSGLPRTLVSDEVPLRPEDVTAYFSERVVGQPEAVGAVVDLVTLVKAELQDPGRPLGVLLFVGPTGSGKTLMAKTLAEYLFGSADKLVRFDMSEYQHPATLPALTERIVEQVRQTSFAVLLLDEVEKAHPLAYDLFLQMFDDARLTDAQGRAVNLRNTIVVLTSNLGSTDQVRAGLGFTGGDGRAPEQEERFRRAVEDHFRPELVNRLDRIVVFRALDPDDVRRIARRELGRVLLREGVSRRNILIQPVPDEVLDLLVRIGFSQAYGARPLQRAVKELVLLPVARQIAARPAAGDQLLDLRVEGGQMVAELVAVAAPTAVRQTPSASRGVAAGLRELVETVLALRARLVTQVDSPGFLALQERKHGLVEQTQLATFWDDPERSRETLVGIHHLERLTDRLTELRDRAERLSEQCAALQRAPNDARVGQLESAHRQVEAEAALAELELLASDPDTVASSGAFIIITAVTVTSARGQPGDDWAPTLCAMYAAWAERKGYEVETVSEPTSAETILAIRGGNVVGMLRGEVGLHRRQTPPEERESREPGRRVETRQARVDLLPLLAEWATQPAELQVRDLGPLPATGSGGRPRRLVEASAGAGGARVRLVSVDASRLARALLAARLAARDVAAARVEVVREYSFERTPVVRDPRTGLQSRHPREVLAGDLDAFLVAFLRGQRIAQEQSEPDLAAVAATPTAPSIATVPPIRVGGDGEGGADPGLAETLANARDGATIELASGTYRLQHPVTLRASLTLAGAGLDSTELVGEHGNGLIRFEGAGRLVLRDLTFRWTGAGVGDLVSVTAGELTAERCRFIGAGIDEQVAGAGLEIGGQARATVDDCELRDNGYGLLAGGEAVLIATRNRCVDNRLTGLAYLDASTGQATENHCARNVQFGLFVGDRAQPRLIGSSCEANGTGIGFSDAAGGSAEQNVCQKNRGPGLAVAGQARPTLQANRSFENSGSGISYAEGAGGLARANSCRDNGQQGIDVTNHAAPELIENECLKNGSSGIRYTDSAAGSAHGNTCAENSQHGIYASDQAAPTLETNRCDRNGVDGISVRDSAGPRLIRNICRDNGDDGIYVASGTSATLEANQCSGNKSNDLNDGRS